MFIVFGWGHTKTHNYGEINRSHCSRCNSETAWELNRTSEWFTLFFLPVFPYLRKNYVSCSVCGNTVEINTSTAREVITSLDTGTTHTPELFEDPEMAGKTEIQKNYIRHMREVSQERYSKK